MQYVSIFKNRQLVTSLIDRNCVSVMTEWRLNIMAKAKKRKAKANKEKNIKSLFFYGNPNAEKLNKLITLQTLYTDSINGFIMLLSDSNTYLWELLNNDNKSSTMRKFENDHRVKKLKSALSQTACDEAVEKLHNRVIDIKNEVFSVDGTIFSSSLWLFYCSITDKSRKEILQRLEEIRDEYKKKAENTKNKASADEKQKFYDDMITYINKLSDIDLEKSKAIVRGYYEAFSKTHKIPQVKKAHVRLDSRTYTLEESKDVATSHVISITDIDKRSGRFEVPIQCSRNSLRRMEQYGANSTVTYTVTDEGLLRVAVTVEKKVKLQDIDSYIGVDSGIKDVFHTSDGRAIGSFKELIDFYQTTINPNLDDLNRLRIKKRKLESYLEEHALPNDVKASIEKKLKNIDKNINENKIAKKNLNRYYHQLHKIISQSIQEYVKGINKNTMTVIELLDIKEFNKSKYCNQMLSTFARGLLAKKLMEYLNWYGYAYTEVDPAYTSQVCPHCHNLDSNNRSSEDSKDFTCTHCGFHDDADHVGATNIAERILDEVLLSICDVHKYNTTARHAAIKEYYKEKHEAFKKAESIRVDEAIEFAMA